MEWSLSKLEKIYNRCTEYRNYVEKNQRTKNRSDLSDFWADILKSKGNFPTFHEMVGLQALNLQSGVKSATRLFPGSLESRLDEANAAYEIMSREVPQDFLNGLPESGLGVPTCLQFFGYTYFDDVLRNSLNTYRILEWCKARNLTSRPLRILEIGAGYGQVATQLHHYLPIETYAICDLPETLFLSSFFLQATFPEKNGVFLKEENEALGKTNPKGQFIFLIPGLLSKLQGEFDLVINTYSFQEMNLSSVQEYLAFAAEKLSADGFVYSLNSHGKAGVAVPSDYSVEKFDLLSMSAPRRFNFQTFATTPYELVLARKSAKETTPKEHSKRHFDALGMALQFGLTVELKEVLDRFSKNQLNNSEVRWLETVRDLLLASTSSSKRELIKDLLGFSVLTAASKYLAGSLEFSLGHFAEAKTWLEQSYPELGKSPAKARALLMLAVICGREQSKSEASHFLQEAKEITPFLSKEYEFLYKHPETLSSQTSSQLGIKENVAPAGLRGLKTRAFRKFRRHFSELTGQT